MKIAIVDYHSGNIRSVLFALERLGVSAELTDEASAILSADKVIFPGVGEASSAMKVLREKKLDRVIAGLKQPVLGICLGMQLMCKHSEEGDTSCIGIFNQEVKKFQGNEKIPQVGWNTISKLKTKLFEGIAQNTFVYFVHSYYVEKGVNTIATTNYSIDYSSAMQQDNFYGVQFHPEKSAEAGSQILENFLKRC